MKRILIYILLFVSLVNAQEFVVEKLSGEVYAMRGTEETWKAVKIGQKLNARDFISTSEKSFIQLSNKDENFILKSNSAVNLNSVKKMTLNELMLALAAEEIRSIPVNKNQNNLKNTAVYGKEEVVSSKVNSSLKDLGIKRINGAKQLAENGFRESAVLFAKETYRKYPNTKTNIDNRLYFVDLMLKLNMKNEAASELADIKNSNLSSANLKEVDTRIDKLNKENITK